MHELNQEELDQFTDVMLEKVRIFRYLPADEELRAVVQQVIVDTQLLTTEAVPLKRWLMASVD